MPRLAKYLISGGGMTICNRRVRPRFFYIIGFLLALVIVSLSTLWIDYASIWDRLRPDCFVTSNYMKSVFCKEME